MIKTLRFLLFFNIIAVIVFFVGMFTAFYHVRDAVMWYTVNKAMNQTEKYPTGYEVFLELNKYRAANKLPPLELSQPLCNNLAARWQNYKKTNSHAGFQDFVDIWFPGQRISEILAPGKTSKEMVNKWASSPGHDLAIKTHSKICVYSAEGLSVGLLSN